MTYANELFCNPLRSHSDVFNIICNFKHDMEIASAKDIIKNSIIFKTIIEDLQYEKFTTYMQWDGYGKIQDENFRIIYKSKLDYHRFIFIYNNGKRFIRHSFRFNNSSYCKSFETLLFEELKNNQIILKSIFKNTVLLGKRKEYLFY